MAWSNDNNRPDVFDELGNLNSTGQHIVYYAHKKVKLKNAVLVSPNNVGGDATNFASVQLQVEGREGAAGVVPVGPRISSVPYVGTKLIPLVIPDEYVLFRGEMLLLDVVETGRFQWARVGFGLDYIVKGN